MNKAVLRQEFINNKSMNYSYRQCRELLRSKYNYRVTLRTLRRWDKRFNGAGLSYKDLSKRPNKLYYKITPEVENKIVSLRRRTGWGENKISVLLPDISHTSIHKILAKHNLCNNSKEKKQASIYSDFYRLHDKSMRVFDHNTPILPNHIANRERRKNYVSFQRKHPNMMWQIDHSFLLGIGKWCFSVIDDCSRYSLALVLLDKIDSAVVMRILKELIAIHGKPSEILSDNGSVYGSMYSSNDFDAWCRKCRITHIRSSFYSPTTCGKVERLFQTIKYEMPFCNDDLELFRLRYNHFRPHESLRNRTPAEVYF